MRRRHKPGPKALLVNPYPVPFEDDEGNEYEEDPHLSASELDRSERKLRDYFLKHRRELSAQPDENPGQATWRILKLVTEGLTDTRAADWSALEDWDHEAEAPPMRMVLPLKVSRLPPPGPMRGDLWLDTSSNPRVVKEYAAPRTWHIVLDNIKPNASPLDVRKQLSEDRMEFPKFSLTIRWPQRAQLLRDEIKSMLANRMGRAGKNGRPAFLACAALAVLLEVDTSKAVDLLANYRRTLPVSKRSH